MAYLIKLIMHFCSDVELDTSDYLFIIIRVRIYGRLLVCLYERIVLLKFRKLHYSSLTYIYNTYCGSELNNKRILNVFNSLSSDLLSRLGFKRIFYSLYIDVESTILFSYAVLALTIYNVEVHLGVFIVTGVREF